MEAAARAVAEPTRRDILRLVHEQERTASNIASHFAVSRPAISQHLRVLSDAELVTVRTDGTRRYYQARPEGLTELSEWIESFWSSSLARLKTAAEQEHENNNKGNTDA